jgi:aminocarboxymuconate-semialdehyde decarboxylase
MSIPGGWDVHVHLVPPAVVAAGEQGRYGMRRETGTLHICAHGVPLHPLSDVGALIDRISSDRLDGAVVSVPPPLFRPDLTDADRLSYAGMVNDGLLAACASHGATLRPFAYLPIENPEMAARIAAELDHHWAGVIAGTDLGALSYASERYDPLWQVLAESGLPLFIHPGSSPDRRLAPFYLANLLGNPVETTIAAANLVFAGVLRRFPGLKIILAHGGGCVAALCGRWQLGVATRRPGTAPLALERCGPPVLRGQPGAFVGLARRHHRDHRRRSRAARQRLAVSDGSAGGRSRPRRASARAPFPNPQDQCRAGVWQAARAGLVGRGRR